MFFNRLYIHGMRGAQRIFIKDVYEGVKVSDAKGDDSVGQLRPPPSPLK